MIPNELFAPSGANCAWLSPEGEFHLVEMHEALHTQYKGAELHGYGAFRHGWVRIYTYPSVDDMGVEVAQRPTPKQFTLLVALATQLGARVLYASKSVVGSEAWDRERETSAFTLNADDSEQLLRDARRAIGWLVFGHNDKENA